MREDKIYTTTPPFNFGKNIAIVRDFIINHLGNTLYGSQSLDWIHRQADHLHLNIDSIYNWNLVSTARKKEDAQSYFFAHVWHQATSVYPIHLFRSCRTPSRLVCCLASCILSNSSWRMLTEKDGSLWQINTTAATRHCPHSNVNHTKSVMPTLLQYHQSSIFKTCQNNVSEIFPFQNIKFI